MGTPRVITGSNAHVRNGGRPKFDDATIAEIKRKSDAGATNPQLASEYGVKTDRIRRAIIRAEFGGI